MLLMCNIKSLLARRNHLALVMEYADGGDMSEAVDRHILKEVWAISSATYERCGGN
jgi:hypothetical protein